METDGTAVARGCLPADEDGAEMEQFVQGGNLALIILPQQMCDTNILQMCAVAQMYKLVAAAEKERAGGSFSVRWSRRSSEEEQE